MGANTQPGPVDAGEWGAANAALEPASAAARVAWALAHGGEASVGSAPVVLSSSFGAQSAVMLHLATRQRPGMPVVFVDTGYLFPETYRFVDELTERLELDVHVYRATTGPAWQEARWGKLWEQGVEGLERYNQINKVEPMQRALRELGARVWLAGLRRQHSASRRALPVVASQRGVVKVHPIVDWTDRDVHRYLKRHDLPYHPMWERGYVSIGDVHTTRPLGPDMLPEETRFFGWKRECGLHEIRLPVDAER